MNKLYEIASEIRERDYFTLIGHAIPDGDCIGSLLALYYALLAMGKQVQILLQDPVPEIYTFLNGSDRIKDYNSISKPLANVIFLDCSDEERVGEKLVKDLKNREFTICIDHHQSNDCFGDLNYVDPTAAATAEIIFDLLKLLKVEIDGDIASSLYVGLVQDTGSFQHSNTSSKTLRSAADLLESGVDLQEIKGNLFESKKQEDLAILSMALQSMAYSNDGRIAWMILPYEDLKMAGLLDVHPEGIINYTLKVRGVELGLLFREFKPGSVKIGFRSKGKVDVASLASVFGGGGHRQASGAKQEGNILDVKEKVISVIKDVIG